MTARRKHRVRAWRLLTDRGCQACGAPRLLGGWCLTCGGEPAADVEDVRFSRVCRVAGCARPLTWRSQNGCGEVAVCPRHGRVGRRWLVRDRTNGRTMESEPLGSEHVARTRARPATGSPARVPEGAARP